MTNSERAFLALAETLNFTRAAEKIYISQQGLSDHIRKLEEIYDTILVYRKPTVTLSQAGEALHKMLLQQEAMEKDIRQTISEINGGEAGEVSLGISSTRVRTFAADIIARYNKQHPNVHVTLISDLTVNLEQQLLRNELDGLIAVEPYAHPDLDIESIFDDPIYIAVPTDIAEKRTGSKTRVDIKEYSDLPFIRDVHDSTTDQMISKFLNEKNITLNNIISVDEYAVQAALCERLKAAMFCARSYAFYKQGSIAQSGLKILGIKGLHQSVKIALVTSNKRAYSQCALDFFETVKNSLQDFEAEIMKE